MKSIIVGFGRIANSIRHDQKMAKYFPMASHAQVLDKHPAFDWIGVVDQLPAARKAAWDEWQMEATNSPHTFSDAEFAVLAIPPAARLGVIEALPDLKAVLLEKPAGDEALLAHCDKRHIAVHVNFWRRGDDLYRELASWRLPAMIGAVQAVFCTYGNGLYNNGSHLVDFIRMLLGEVTNVKRTTEPVRLGVLGCSYPNVKDDWHVGFNLTMASGVPVSVLPLDYRHYREFGVDIWGTAARLALYQESLGVFYYNRGEHRAMRDQREIENHRPVVIPSTQQTALYNFYSNIAAGDTPWSSGDSALITNRVLDAIIDS